MNNNGIQDDMSLLLRKSVLAFVAGSALLLTACGDKNNDSGETLATVNGVAVKSSRVDEQMAQIPAAMMQGREADVRRQILDRVIDQELIAQEAKRLKVAGDEAYKKQLQAVENQLQANYVIAKKVSETVTPEAIKQAYDANKANISFPAVKARHILVPTEAEANSILATVTPANFASMAKQFSKGPSASTGGELGWFRREAMIPEFATVAFATTPGTVARTPVKTQFGWHVILVEERNDRYTPPVEMMEPQLRQELAQTVVQGYLTDLRKGATITYSEGTAPAAVSPTAAK